MNYVSHLIDYFNSKPVKKVLKDTPIAFSKIYALLELARRGEKFELPDGGRSIENLKLREEYADLIRLPYPICVLEYSYQNSTFEVGGEKNIYGIETSTFNPNKRIALCFDAKLIPFGAMDDGIVIVSMFNAPGGWIFAPMGAHISTDVFSSCGANGGIKFTPIKILDEYLDDNEYGDKDGMSDLHDELCSSIEFMIAINCANVEKEKSYPSKVINKCRASKFKTPFDSYWILDIYKEHLASGKPNGGSHASPRLHFRRGHIRRLSNGKATWVRNCLVGNPDKGVVEKSYAIQKVEGEIA